MEGDLHPMTPADCVAVKLRREDSLECRAIGARDDADALRTALRLSHVALTWRIDGRRAAFAGLVLHGNGEGTPWLLTTDMARSRPHRLYRMALRFLHAQPCDVLRQQVDAEYPAALAFLQRLGFVAGEAAPFGPFGHSFRPVEWRR